MKRCTLDTNIITGFLKKDVRIVKRVSDYLEYFDRLTININSYYEILRGLKNLGNVEKLNKFEEFVQKRNHTKGCGNLCVPKDRGEPY